MYRLSISTAKIAYFDHAATTPLALGVFKAMSSYMQADRLFGNASSQTHKYGAETAEAVELARRKVARSLGAAMREIIWTSGATEANNLAILGFAKANAGKKKNLRVITCATEHKAVLDPVLSLKASEIEPIILPVGKSGLVDLDRLDKELAKGAMLASFMWCNNETGAIQPIAKICKLCSRYGVALHVDATQAMGKVSVDLKKEPISLLSLSSHKIYGPKGCGILFVRSRTKLAPLFFGGGQEKGIRPGTLPVHQIVGMGEACWLASKSVKKDTAHISKLHETLIDIVKDIDTCTINGSLDQKVPHILNLSFKNIKGADLLPSLSTKFALSNGAACTSARIEVSHVLRAMGVTRNLAMASVRISMGRGNTIKEAKSLGHALKKAVARLSF